MAEKTLGPDLAELQREETRLHYCLATEGLGSAKGGKRMKRDPDNDGDEHSEYGKSGY